MTNKEAKGIYLHIPFCRSRCSYCGFVLCTDCGAAESYVDALVGEIGERVGGSVDSVYIGGGTPSVLPRGSLKRIFSALREHADFSSDCEITSEANPDSCDGGFLDEARSCGVNRLSLGVQSLNDKLLSKIGRRHNRAQAVDAVKRAKKHGFDNISCDIMLALPDQTVSDAENTAQELCGLGVTHISAYALGVEKGTPLYENGYMPDEDLSADMYDAVYKRLTAQGFERYEVSNFCKYGKYSRHNMKYWTRTPYIGLGAAAHSFENNIRSYNTSDIADYIKGERGSVSEEMRQEDALEEYIMLGLRTSRGIKYAELDALCGGGWRERKAKTLKELIGGGFIAETEDGLKLTESAYYVMNGIILRLI